MIQTPGTRFGRTGLRRDAIATLKHCPCGEATCCAVSVKGMERFWELRPRQPFTGLLCMAVLGILGAEWCPVSLGVIYGLLALASLGFAWRPCTVSCWVLTGTAFFALHSLRQQHGAATELSAAFLAGSRVVQARGIVWSDPELTPPGGITRARFTLKLVQLELDGRALPTDALIRVAWAGSVPAYGDQVSCTGAGENLAHPSNPGVFDFTADQHRRGIYTELRTRYAADCQVLEHGKGNRLMGLAIDARAWVKTQLERDLEDAPEIAALIESMVLGLSGETSADTKLLFQQTGTMHLFAVSGLNVAMVGALVWFLLKPFRIGRRAGVWVSIPILIGYAVVTGLSASCVRATVMGVLFLLAYLVDRRPIFHNSLSAAGFVILAWDSNQLFLTGFQFSFVLVLTIVLLAARFERWLAPLGCPDAFLPRSLFNWRQKLVQSAWNAISGTLAVTLAAWLGSLLFTAGYFHLFAPAALLANLIAVPIAFAILALGLLSIVSACLSPWASILFNNANWLAAKALLFFLKCCALIPGGHVYLQIPRLAPAPDCEVTVLALGSGGAAHLRSGGRDWLWDCGSAVGYAHVVLPYLRSRGVNSLDGLLLSHGDSQHLGGACAALSDFEPRQIVDSVLSDRSPARRAFHRQLAAQGRGKGLYQRGDVFEISRSVSVRVLFPAAGLKRGAADDKALVLMLECDGVRVLWMFDSGFITEQWLIENEPDMSCDILVKGQHQKDWSATPEFLARTHPQAVLCSGLGFGQDPQPLADWEARVSALGIVVFREDRCGAVQLEIDGRGWSLRGFLNAQTLRSRAR